MSIILDNPADLVKSDHTLSGMDPFNDDYWAHRPAGYIITANNIPYVGPQQELFWTGKAVAHFARAEIIKRKKNGWGA